MKQIKTNNKLGMTLTELLAVLMIISLLATIAVPVYVSRQEDARIRVAQGETREIAMAEETVAALHGFYVPFQLLDDLPADRNNNLLNEERIDRNPYANNLYLIDPSIRAEDQFISGVNQRQLNRGYVGSPVIDGVPDVRARKLVDNWSGPYLNFQRFWYDLDNLGYESPSDPDYRDYDDMFRDFPLDPWGNPYRFYSPIGVLGDAGDNSDYLGNQFRFDNPDLNFSNGRMTRNDERRFQRYAVVSFGRDGIADTDPLIPNANNVIDNDIYHEFGTDGFGRNFGKF